MYSNNQYELINTISIEVADVFKKIIIKVPPLLSDILFIPTIIPVYPETSRFDDNCEVEFITHKTKIACTLPFNLFESVEEFINLLNDTYFTIECYELYTIVPHKIKK